MKITYDKHNNVAYILECDDDSQQRIIDYWIPERKAKAISMTPVLEGNIEQAKTSAATDPQKADLKKMPFADGGKLYMTISGEDYVASANIMENKNILLTAAHCVQDRETGAIGYNFLFERGYNSGKAVEKFTFKTITLKEYWHSTKEWKWDYSIVILNGSSNAETPLQYSLENVRNKELTLFGYPLNYYAGEEMVFVTGKVVNESGNTTWKIEGCKMRGGCSGGAWVLDDKKTVVGINSYILTTANNFYIASPIFDKDFESLYQYALTLE